MFRSFAAAALLVLASATAAVHAEPTPAEIAVARRLFHRATSLQKEARWAECSDALRDAIAIKDTAGLRFHLARCEEEQGHLVEALVEYDRADELLARGGVAPDVKRLLGPARERLEARVPTLTVMIPESIEGAKLTLDGHRVKPSLVGRPIPRNPAECHVVVVAEGYRDFKVTLRLNEGERRVLQADLVREPPPKPARTLRSKPAARKKVPSDVPKPAGGAGRTWVLVGESAFTMVALGIGVGFTLSASSAEDRIQRNQEEVDRRSGGDQGACDGASGRLADACGALRDAIDAHDGRSSLATIGFVGAGVGAVATAVTFLVWRPGGPSATAVSIAPRTGGLAWTASGSF